jgi:hypothetical protein
VGLSDATCKRAKPKPGKYETVFTDIDGLELWVTAKTKTWRWRFRYNGQRDRIKLGRFPELGLKKA